ncbi:MAG: coenzyme F420-0:L-glutamate ligase [Nitrosopumilus sp.]|nr:coenzyme F420-0:L-glutamate ligase [Nitrosopumilus sp.]MDF2422809.1 coenzyme F420-0:L-glutamate ligase [Nitrosopumilus sp.]MDF2424467.1 coenzyme F420-0:L-glutamate ligase [Nitrosopumilus sp.]MDF2424873.1 coenzyme F420-0:L-glutamate ligase [Nitrosopumilus sp.]MDF2427322.1 coenzyme F420-0:L-glutamate ligase [Nitrosopumilus sp.]
MQIIPIHFEKEIEPSDDISDIILKSEKLRDGDIVVVAQKIISKQEGRLIDLSTVIPSLLAEGISSQYHKDPKITELILSESKRIVRMKNGILIVETNQGFICANAGIDESNVREGYATLLPVNSDVSAQKIRKNIFEQSNKNVAVIISDTFGRPFRMGQTNHAIGVSGLNPILDYVGTLDSFNKVLRVTAIAIADELTSASELVMGKSLKCPIVIIRDYLFKPEDHSVDELIRPEHEDLFR